METALLFRYDCRRRLRWLSRECNRTCAWGGDYTERSYSYSFYKDYKASNGFEYSCFQLPFDTEIVCGGLRSSSYLVREIRDSGDSSTIAMEIDQTFDLNQYIHTTKNRVSSESLRSVTRQIFDSYDVKVKVSIESFNGKLFIGDVVEGVLFFGFPFAILIYGLYRVTWRIASGVWRMK